ncbi:hypothetical protein ALC57_08636, partial [Trachymyrmex cornetzi]
IHRSKMFKYRLNLYIAIGIDTIGGKRAILRRLTFLRHEFISSLLI